MIIISCNQLFDKFINKINLKNFLRQITRPISLAVSLTIPSTLIHVSICYETHKMCEKAVDTCPFMLDCVPNCYKMQKKYFFSKYKSQEICSKGFDAFPPLLNFVPDLYVTNKVVKDLDDAVSFNDNLVFFNADSDNLTFLVMI